MTLKSTRSLQEMREVMLDPQASGPDPVYQVFTELNDHFWINKTVIQPGRLGREFTKTLGHYHQVHQDEIYYVASGSGIVTFQNDNVVLLVRCEVGEQVIITPDLGHNWSNVGDGELVLFDNWSVPHSPTDYAWVEIEHGMGYYLTGEKNAISLIPNPNYAKLPSASWLTADEFSRYAK